VIIPIKQTTNLNFSDSHCYLVKLVLYKNFDLKLLNKLHGTIHYYKTGSIGVTCVFNDTCFILSCNNTTLKSTYFKMQQSV